MASASDLCASPRPGWATLPRGDARQPLAVALALRLAAGQSRADVAHVWAEALQALVGWRSLKIELTVPPSGRVLPLLQLGSAGSPAGPRRTAATTIDLSLPLARNAGVLRVDMERDAMYTGSERALVEDICNHCRTAMSRADAQERMAESYRRLNSFGRLALRLGEQTTRREAGQLIADIADELIGWDACFFDLYDATNGTIREMINIDTIGGVKKAVQGHHTSGPPGRLERRLLDEGGFLLEQDVQAPSEYSLFGDESRPSAAMLFVPARHRGEVVAFFSIQSYAPHAYSSEDLALLQTLADHCAGALARIRLEEQLLHAACYDHLTQLPNRALFMDRLKQQFARCKRQPDYRFALVYLDLDRFKQVNDQFGHATGDALLADVARRLAAQCRPTDTAARMGGDEFTLLIEDGADRDAIARIAQRISAALAEPLQIEGKDLRPSASIGVAVSTPSSTPDSLLREADAALYRVKREQRGGIAFAG